MTDYIVLRAVSLLFFFSSSTALHGGGTNSRSRSSTMIKKNERQKEKKNNNNLSYFCASALHPFISQFRGTLKKKKKGNLICNV